MIPAASLIYLWPAVASQYITVFLLGRIAVQMRPIVTHRVVWSVGLSVSLSVCHTSEPCKNCWTDIEIDTVWVGNHVLDGVQIPHGKGQFCEKGVPVVKYRDFLSCAVQNAVWPIDLPFWSWTRVGRRKHKFNHIRQVAPMCNLVNTIESSTCCEDAALCQITLTTCYYCYSNNRFSASDSFYDFGAI